MTVALAIALMWAQLGLAAVDPAPVGVDVAALETCTDSLDVAIFNVPRYPHRKRPLKILVVSEHDLGEASVVAVGPQGEHVPLTVETTNGPPWGWVAQVPKPQRGDWRVALVNAEGVAACQDIKVRRGPWGNDDIGMGTDPTWQARIKWERDTENLYSLWIEQLFAAPLDEDISWRPLSQVLRDPERNLLYDYMGLDEDRDGKDGVRAKPDCADFPYYLRGYFSWKLGLPFAYRACRRGDATRPPRCSEDTQTNELPALAASRVGAFSKFIRKVQGTVHSSSLRSLPKDEKSDFYPVALTRKALRPGTIYTDPYGHTMMVGTWAPQQADTSGVLMAIDAQPDGTIGRRRFWRGSFMFPDDDAVAGAGWKRFRPVKREREGYVTLDNAAISKSIDYGDYSVEQWENGKDAFYERMDALINPHPLPPSKGLLATVDALDQQVRRRVESVANGEQWKRDHAGKTMKMPTGSAIFITSGPWEDYSTPSRDMRLLIAIDTVLNFPGRVERYPERFVMPEGVEIAALKRQLEAEVGELTKARTYTYQRSDGSDWTLTLADIIARRVALEVSYNPNDCVEVRWAAPEGSDERRTCTQRAPSGQTKKMAEYRAWFQKRERPATTD